MEIKYIFVLGGNVSGLGKGIVSASIGRLLKDRGFRVTIQKMDPYLNIDPGTLSPYQHGEVFCLSDGTEADLDLGSYERFVDLNLSELSSTTSGKVYRNILRKERKGEYLGKTVQVVPHVTDEIKNRIYNIAEYDQAEVVITELGGTVGDIEGLPFIESVRQIRSELGKRNTLFVFLTYLPYISASEELKTKPTQHAVSELRGFGIQPDILICRFEQGQLTDDIKKKISMFCDVDAVLENKTVDTVMEVPLILKEQGLDAIIVDKLHMPQTPSKDTWQVMVNKFKNINRITKIAVVGKYTELPDAYKSISEALMHGGMANDTKVKISWINSEEIENQAVEEILSPFNGILIPGGFGPRGVQGKINTIQYARLNKVPLFGICLGMQCIVIEYARNVLGLTGANSTEFEQTDYPIITLLDSQQNVTKLGGTLRLGAYPTRLKESSLAQQAYNTTWIKERHRHRWEVNPSYRKLLEDKGLRVTGVLPDDSLVEIVELDQDAHPWFLGCQFHPELTSRPNRPNPLFSSFVQATIK